MDEARGIFLIGWCDRLCGSSRLGRGNGKATAGGRLVVRLHYDLPVTGVCFDGPSGAFGFGCFVTCPLPVIGAFQ